MQMIALYVSALLIAISYFFIDSVFSIWLLALAQFILLFRELCKGQVSGVGGFVFMSFLFFAVRPLYIVLEDDYRLLTNLFRLQVNLSQLTDSMWWASLAVLSFVVGALFSRRLHKLFGISKKLVGAVNSYELITLRQVRVLLFVQLIFLLLMFYLAGFGRALYAGSMGAYVYDLPVPLQAVNIITLVLLFDRMKKRKSPINIAYFGGSLIMFLYFTWLMREVTIFRGFYVFGVMIGMIALLQRVKPKVGYAWLLIPILVLQPFFQTLGNVRTLDNSSISHQSLLDKTFSGDEFFSVYWDFYDSQGDINIFDTFVAAQSSHPESKPYIMSWIYAPLHIVPRSLWKDKPDKGILQDVSFMYGAPYSPGIAGFFLLDGGLVWMLLSMFMLGIVVSLLDSYSTLMLHGAFRSCVIGIIVVNSMFLTRSFLWFSLWQVVYAVVPIYLVCRYLFGKNAIKARILTSSQI